MHLRLGKTDIVFVLSDFVERLKTAGPAACLPALVGQAELKTTSGWQVRCVFASWQRLRASSPFPQITPTLPYACLSLAMPRVHLHVQTTVSNTDFLSPQQFCSLNAAMPVPCDASGAENSCSGWGGAPQRMLHDGQEAEEDARSWRACGGRCSGAYKGVCSVRISFIP